MREKRAEKNNAQKSTKKPREKLQKMRNIPQDSRDRYFQRVTYKFQNINKYTYNFADHVSSERDKNPTVELLASHEFESTIVPNVCSKDYIIISFYEPENKKPYHTQIWSIKNIFE